MWKRNSAANGIPKTFFLVGAAVLAVGLLSPLAALASSEPAQAAEAAPALEVARAQRAVPAEVANGASPETGLLAPAVTEADGEDPGFEGLGDDVDLEKFPPPGSWLAPAMRDGFLALNGPLPIQVEPGTLVPHQFDVVVANLFYSSDDFPSGPAPMSVSESDIDAMLAAAAAWWSRHTGLDFDFNTDTSYAAINSTCGTLENDALAANGLPRGDLGPYINTNRDLLILQVNSKCGDYEGVTLRVPNPPSVFVGGAFEVVVETFYDAARNHRRHAAVLAHEFGHTLGLWHSNLGDCTNVVLPGDDQVGPSWDGTYLGPGTCTHIEYGDVYSAMGDFDGDFDLQTATLSVAERWRLGVVWDGHGAVVLDEVGIDRTVTLARADLAGHQLPGGIVIPQNPGIGVAEYLSLEYRPQGASTTQLPGVYLADLSGTGTVRLTPAGANAGPDARRPHLPLRPGDSYVSADGAVQVETVSVTDTSAQVRVKVIASGLRGSLSIIRDGETLTATFGYPADRASDVAYQWFRNGQPIPGATQRSFAPVLPDPNAVYRVESTSSTAGAGPTKRTSRGIIPDDHRFTIAGNTATLVMLDQNGQPVDCLRQIVATVRAPSGEMIYKRLHNVNPTSQPGTCQAPISLGLTGAFEVTALAQSDPQPATYWQPLSATMTNPGSGASAALLLFGDARDYEFDGSVGLRADEDRPYWATVSVSDESGQPAAGVAVQFTVPPGLVATPASAVTGSNGLAQAKVTWDHNIPPPQSCSSMSVAASVVGIGVVGSPASVRVCGNTKGRLQAWYEGQSTAIADGEDPVIIRMRIWDENGQPITNRADTLRVGFLQGPYMGYLVWQQTCGTSSATIISCDTPVWNEDEQDYSVAITSRSYVWGGVRVAFEWDGQSYSVGMAMDVKFVAGPAVRITGGYTPPSPYASADGVCDDGSAAETSVGAFGVSASGRFVGVAGNHIRFDLPAGSPLVFRSDPGPLPEVRGGAYSVDVTSPVAGNHYVQASTADGALAWAMPVDFRDGAPDPIASTVSVSGGTRKADGKESHQLTSQLVSVCHAPIIGASSASTLRLEARHTGSGALEPAVTATSFTWDAASSTYRANITSTKEGTYDLTVVQRWTPWQEWPRVDKDVIVNSTPVQVTFGADSGQPFSTVMVGTKVDYWGGAAVGKTLTANAVATPQPDSWAYQWLRDGEPIPGATAKTYILAPDDAAHMVGVRATATKAGYASTSAVSSLELVLQSFGSAAASLAVDNPAARSHAWVGDTLTVTVYCGPPADSIYYTWYRDAEFNSPLKQGTGADSYTLRPVDAGHEVWAWVECRKQGHETAAGPSAFIPVQN
ncbi:MAG: Ig-like domain-containing protein [Micrococcales bacterium]|nr:Ig-like domain-containing protein [Micrococcales bacterium]